MSLSNSSRPAPADRVHFHPPNMTRKNPFNGNREAVRSLYQIALDVLVMTTEYDVNWRADAERVMTGRIDPKKIKSATRVLEVFEFFNADRSSATVMEIARALGYPQSSTSELLSCLVDLGYMRRDRSARNYRPTARVAMLSAWVHPKLMRHGNLFRIMDSLALETGHRVILAGANGVKIQNIHAVGNEDIPSDSEGPNSLIQGVMGHLLLSVYDYRHIRKIVHRLNAEAVELEQRVCCEDLLNEIDRIRRRGHAATPGLEDGKGGICGVLLPRAAADEPLALGLVVEPGEGDVEQSLRSLRNAVAQHLGPVLAHHNGDVAEPIRQLY